MIGTVKKLSKVDNVDIIKCKLNPVLMFILSTYILHPHHLILICYYMLLHVIFINYIPLHYLTLLYYTATFASACPSTFHCFLF